MSSVDESTVFDALRNVMDPEAGMNIVDLGLVYAVEVVGGRVRVEVTMTSAACPMADMIVDDIYAAVQPLARDIEAIDVQVVWDPPWTPDRMSDLAREQFGWGLK